ncbi:DUF1381 domain-containing protein [Staphylococcus xylosus]|uniref:DUF1381 domain-containing protein n=1 Tax=Staphylococcus xylosus TaxID=1288 RepID=UPI003FEF96AB|nr:DUF1381 domain-containing protein [Staphylococcus xylosus]MCQ3819252.1 DUF1381 domain-containing protein [Staphylococcus xylosus]
MKHTTHTTGETFTDVIKIRDNETYQVVTGRSKQDIINRLDCNECPNCGSKIYTEEMTYIDNKAVYLTKSCYSCMMIEGVPLEKDSE